MQLLTYFVVVDKLIYIQLHYIKSSYVTLWYSYSRTEYDIAEKITADRQFPFLKEVSFLIIEINGDTKTRMKLHITQQLSLP